MTTELKTRHMIYTRIKVPNWSMKANIRTITRSNEL